MSRTILERRPLPSRVGLLEAEIVLVHLPDNPATPYVTWQRNVADGSTYWGHYFYNLDEAEADFADRGRG